MAEGKKKKKILIPKVVDGHEEMVEIEVDDDPSAWPERSAMRVLHHRIPRLDGPEKVTGRAVFTHDVRLPGMLYARALLAPRPNARVTSLDLSAAKSMPGVKAVLAVPNKHARFQGDPIAAVAALTPEQAEDAIRAIKVSYNFGPCCVDPLQALAGKGAPVHPEGNVRREETHGDLAKTEAAMAGCAAVAEGEYRTPVQHHSCWETHGVVVDYRGGDSATVYASTQGTFTIPRDAAAKLGLEADKVKSVVHHMGGGFGSKFGLDVPGALACQLSRQARLPVHLMLTRHDEFLLAGNRSGSLQRLKLGADRTGKLVAMVARQYRLGGLGLGSQRAQPHIYQVPQVYREVTALHTHWDSSRAFRAPGAPQASYAMECIMDDLAARLDMDPIELRKRNCDPKYHRQLDLGAERIGWARGRNRRPGQGQSGPLRRGMGVGLAQWGGGGSPGNQVDVRIAADGRVDVSVGTQDLGTGTRTYIGAIVAEVLSLELKSITVRIGESTMGNASPSGGSITTASLAPAVKDAAEAARGQMLQRLAPALACRPEEIRVGQGVFRSPAGKTLNWLQACAGLKEGLVARGEWRSGLSDNGVEGVQFAEVEVDSETGKVRVLRLVGVQNCGLPLNLLALESQLNGGMIQGMGLALWEEKIVDKMSGRMLNANFGDYKLPGFEEMPSFTPIIDEGDRRQAVVGFAEPCTIPTSGAIANAIFNACGVRVGDLPITPDKLLKALRKA